MQKLSPEPGGEGFDAPVQSRIYRKSNLGGSLSDLVVVVVVVGSL